MVRRRRLLSSLGMGGIASLSLGGGVIGSAVGSHEERSGQRSDRVRRVEPDPEYGFNHPYFLATPEHFRAGPVPLLVETNNADETLSREEEIRRARGQISNQGSHGAWLSEELGVPHLKPIFPENPSEDPIEDRHEISLLDRSTLLLDGTDLDRVDRQLLRMADHARETVISAELAAESESTLHEQFIMYGNSAEGVFAERMAAMHSEEILAVAGAGLNGIVLLPLEQLGGRTLPYHVGVADLESLIGKPYDPGAHDDVNLLFVQGGADTSNRLMMDEEEALRRNNWMGFEDLYLTARDVYGPRMVEDRFPRCQIAFEKAAVSAQFRVVPGMPHDDSMAMHEIRSFLDRSIRGEDVSEFGQQFRLPFDRHVELQTAEPSVGEELHFELSGSYPPPSGLATYEWQVDDGRSKMGLDARFTFDESGDYDVSLSMETVTGQSDIVGMSLLGDGSSFAAFQYRVDPPGPRHLADGTEFLVGETATFEVGVTNVGATPGSRRLEFVSGSETVASTEVQLAPSESTTVSFEHAFEEGGEVVVGIPPAYEQTMTVSPRVPEGHLLESAISSSELETGQPMRVTTTVENSGTGRGEIDLELSANGAPIAQTTVTLDVNQSETVSFEHAFADPGEYELAINGESVGSVSVTRTRTSSPTPETQTSPTDTSPRSETSSAESTTPSPSATPSSTATSTSGQAGLGVLPAVAGIASVVSYLLSRDEPDD